MTRPHRLLALAVLAAAAGAGEPTAFDFGRAEVAHAIDLKEVRKGNPAWPEDPRDRIPPIDEPVITTAKDADRFLKGSDRVLGVVIGKEARAYPLLVLQVHEMCNDTLGGRPIAPNY